MFINVTNEIELIEAFRTCNYEKSEYNTINISSGTYYLSETLSLNSENIKIVGDCANRPILDFHKTLIGTNALVITGNNIEVYNIVVRYSGYKGIFAKTTNSTFENIDVYGNCDCGFQLKNSSNTKVIGCCSYNNFGYMTMNGEKPNFGFNSDGFCDKQYDGPGNIWIDCKSWGNSDDGFDFYERITPIDRPTIIENCVAFGNGGKKRDISKNPRIEVDVDFFKKNNYELTNYPSYGNGNGFKLGGNFAAHNIILKKCLSFDNSRNGFGQNNNIGKMILEKCVASGNGLYNYGFRTYDGELLMKNSIGNNGNDSIITKNVKFKNS